MASKSLLLVFAAAFAVLTGCDQSELSSTVTVASVSDGAEDEIAPSGAIDCDVLCVSEIAKDPKAHAGRVAVRGVVSKVFADRRAFTVANIVEGASCCATGCGNDSVPVRVPTEEYEGDLPAEFEHVILVGEVVPNPDDEGYDFVIEEVWADGKVVVRKQA